MVATGRPLIGGVGGILSAVTAAGALIIAMADQNWVAFDETETEGQSAVFGLTMLKRCGAPELPSQFSCHERVYLSESPVPKEDEFMDAGIAAVLFFTMTLIVLVFSMIHYAHGILGRRRWFLRFTRWAGVLSALLTMTGFLLWLIIRPSTGSYSAGALGSGFAFAIIGFVLTCATAVFILLDRQDTGQYAEFD